MIIFPAWKYTVVVEASGNNTYDKLHLTVNTFGKGEDPDKIFSILLNLWFTSLSGYTEVLILNVNGTLLCVFLEEKNLYQM